MRDMTRTEMNKFGMKMGERRPGEKQHPLFSYYVQSRITCGLRSLRSLRGVLRGSEALHRLVGQHHCETQETPRLKRERFATSAREGHQW